MKLSRNLATLIAIITGVLCLAILSSVVTASAQEARSFEVGQTVEIFCNCFGDNAWTQGKIESIDENGYVVRYGDGTYQTKTVKFNSDRIRDPNKPTAPPASRNSSGNVVNSSETSADNQTDGAQETEFKVGDVVEFACGNCENSRNGWVRAKIVKIDYSRGVGEYILDSGATNQRGEPKYYSEFVTHPNIRTLDEEANEQARQQFQKEAEPYSRAVKELASLYKPEWKDSVYSLSPETLEEHRASLKALNAICQRYPNLKNSRAGNQSTSISYRYADWCALARQGDAMIDKAKAAGLADSLADNAKSVVYLLENAFNGEEGVSEETQHIVFDRAAWEQERRAQLKKNYGNVPEESLKQYFAGIFAEADKVIAQIEREAPTKSWDAPLLHNAALEGYVRNYYANYIKGVQILKIGMYQSDYKTFKNSLGIPTSQVISGVALVKVPNRPFCQSQIFELHKEYLGGGRFSAVKPTYIGTRGTFVKCQ